MSEISSRMSTAVQGVTESTFLEEVDCLKQDADFLNTLCEKLSLILVD